jgi:anhydro-N-acetylmuramic acid kinase
MEASMPFRAEVIGVMSGSSLDGLDLAWCSLEHGAGGWSFNIQEALTVPYDAAFQQRLTDAMHGTALEAARLHRDLGDLIGNACHDLLAGRTVDLIASHGHTLFHKPEEGLTTQIGCGARIAAITGTATVCDFRSKDVAMGGQGAPLVPLGERLLFPEYKFFLNIGGICNISFHFPDHVSGYDLCIANQALNFLAQEAGGSYDHEGRIARSGTINYDLLGKLSFLPLMGQPPPRSIGRDWFDDEVRPLISDQSIPLADRMCTVVAHMAKEIDHHTSGADGLPMLVTGGGAHNTFLMEQLSFHSENTFVVPEKAIVDYKEALIFALLGVLRLQGEANSLASVTGAKHDSVGGAIYLPN